MIKTDWIHQIWHWKTEMNNFYQITKTVAADIAAVYLMMLTEYRHRYQIKCSFECW